MPELLAARDDAKPTVRLEACRALDIASRRGRHCFSLAFLTESGML